MLLPGGGAEDEVVLADQGGDVVWADARDGQDGEGCVDWVHRGLACGASRLKVAVQRRKPTLLRISYTRGEET